MLVGTTEWKQRENMSYLSVVKANLGWDVRLDHIKLSIVLHSLPGLVNILPADEMMPGSVGHHQIHLLPGYLVDLKLARHQDIFVDLLLETFPRRRILKHPDTILIQIPYFPFGWRWNMMESTEMTRTVTRRNICIIVLRII